MKVRVAARFFRAWNYYQLAQQFCETYDIAKANKQLGLPLRIEYDVSTSYGRSRLQEVYDLILKDLNEANEMDLNSELNIYMPGKDAVEALLGRVYLQIGNYDLAEKFATNVLSRKKQLVDYKN
ncbi:RagB/SusD family nutrient uptake outer membrane protein [Sphingobacterium sp. E70]|uniref:RagB/SusD family nutrient uptake outer membrane protein n=1 Tax=Sphingobacterium sp. E70 TaxID=2853439 RepID=UPI00211C4795|nr:RagB/SusD family nutrient uptake outer membrane protein [Sphingobacterium sp. E70]ULT23554.1 RagB/SusD family nutrient uptake outer membrane protein [Sphingobacterium sp. E70]